MATKKADFELLGTVIDGDGKRLVRGQVLSLEVGDDGKPTSSLYSSRVRPLGERVGADEAEGSDEDAKALIKDAKAQAKQIVKDAQAEAKAITDKAEADAQALLDAAKQ